MAKLGEKISEEVRKKMSKAKKGKKLTDKHKKNISLGGTGKKHKSYQRKPFTKETRRKMSLIRIGKKHSEATKQKMKQAFRVPHLGSRGEKHYCWKGDNVKYGSLHDWVRYHLGTPNKCEHCKEINKKKYEWANISKQYKRDLTDWIRLCRSCHKKFDMTKQIRQNMSVGIKKWWQKRKLEVTVLR